MTSAVLDLHTKPDISVKLRDKPGTACASVFRSLNIWRGVAAMWVVLYHATCTVIAHNPSLANSPGSGVFLSGHLGVQLFFVISGYCIANAAAHASHRASGLGRFMWARCRRIYPPCWIAFLLYAGLGVGATLLMQRGVLKISAAANLNILHQGVGFWLANLSLTQIPCHQSLLNVVCWTLCYELAFYLIVGITFLAFRRALGLSERISALHVLTIAALSVLILFPGKLRYPLDLWPQFGLGVLVYDLTSARRSRGAMIVAATIAVQILALILLREPARGANLFIVPTLIGFAVSGVFAIVLIAIYPADERFSSIRLLQPLAIIGGFSYSLYLTHFFVIGLFGQALRVVSRGKMDDHVIWLGTILLAVGFGALFYRIGERPFLNRKSDTTSSSNPISSEHISGSFAVGPAV